jgi:hypothetical protein
MMHRFSGGTPEGRADPAVSSAAPEFRSRKTPRSASAACSGTTSGWLAVGTCSGLHRGARAYILDGSIEPRKVFDATADLEGIPAGCQDMADRLMPKVLVKP